MRMSESGLQFLREREGFSAAAYPDGDGFSIGYGHYGAAVGDIITLEAAERVLLGDVERFEKAVTDALACTVSQQQFDALVSFAYNVGAGAFLTSTLLRRLNEGDLKATAGQFERWNKVKGMPHAGLTARRKLERDLFLS